MRMTSPGRFDCIGGAREVVMGEAKAFGLGLAVGAGLALVLDPRGGAARRARIRDKSLRAVHEVEHAASIGARDLAHRVEGAVARARQFEEHVRSEPDVPAELLVERVRAMLGHACSHPHAIHVVARSGGRVELSGPILASEREHVIVAVFRVDGVRAIDDRLEPHAHADVPVLQGGQERRRRRVVMPPALKLAMGAVAAAFAASSLLAGRPLGAVLGGATVLALAENMRAGASRRGLFALGPRRRARVAAGLEPAPTMP
jgi:hypothetical protein